MIDNGSTDNCGTVTTQINTNSFSCGDIGVNSITFNATDPSENSSECIATVTVVDNVVPTVVCQDITVELDGISEFALSNALLETSTDDNCGMSNNTSVTPGSKNSLGNDRYFVCIMNMDI